MAIRLRPGLPSFRCFCILDALGADSDGDWGLVALFCGFHACCGMILPSLARLRSALVLNELRAGMISFSLAPANAAILFILIQGGYYRNLSNAAILAMAAFGLFTAAGCVHVLKRWKRRTPGNWHER
ncbi:uncharacterized protein LOC144710440 isoform X3 [Wolffia australiana]